MSARCVGLTLGPRALLSTGVREVSTLSSRSPEPTTVTSEDTKETITDAELSKKKAISSEFEDISTKDLDVFQCDEKLSDYQKFVENNDLEELLEVQFSEPAFFIKKVNTMPKEKYEIPIKNSIKTKLNLTKKKTVKPIMNIHNKKFFLKLFAEIADNQMFIDFHLKKIADGGSLDKVEISDLMTFGNSAKAINRSTLKAINKINIFSRKFAEQSLVVDGSTVRLPGSMGADWKKLSYSIQHPKPPKKSNKSILSNNAKSPKSKINTVPVNKLTPRKAIVKRGLLSSMNIQFKPGPLSRKPQLDETLKNGLGNVELVQLPPIGLTISPQIGISVDARISNHLKSIRDPSGLIDAKWAEFAVSTVQMSVDDNSTKKSFHTFIIPYENNRYNMLMRKDLEMPKNLKREQSAKDERKLSEFDPYSHLEFLDSYRGKDDIDSTVKCLMVDLLRSVAISDVQDLYGIKDPDNDYKEENEYVDSNISTNKKRKRKRISELKKLNVTVIDIEEHSQNTNTECGEDFCKLGCVCSSLKNNYLLNEHCGLPECMLNCTCNLESISDDGVDSENTKISSSAIINLQYQMNRNLSKEERKFQQTVIRSNDQTIVLGAQRRGIKLPKKFEEYTTLSLSEIYEEEKSHALKTELKVLLPRIPKKIDCETWCMVHGLYRCFCKNKNVLGDFEYHSTHSNKHLYPKIAHIPLEPTKDDASVPNLIRRKRNKTPTISKHKNNGLDSQSKTIQSTCAEKNTIAKKTENQPLVHLKDLMLDKKIIDAIIKNKSFKVPKEAKYVSSLYPPKNESVVISWCALLGNFSLGKIFIWLSTERPYIPNVTLNKQVNFPYKSVLITESDATLREFYPQFVSDIHNKVILDNTFVVLVGKEYAWSVNGIFCWKRNSNHLEKKKYTIFHSNTTKPSEYESKKYVISADTFASLKTSVAPVTECQENLQGSQDYASANLSNCKNPMKIVQQNNLQFKEQLEDNLTKSTNYITNILTPQQSLLKKLGTNVTINSFKKIVVKPSIKSPETNNPQNLLVSLGNLMSFKKNVLSFNASSESDAISIQAPKDVSISNIRNVITPSGNSILVKNTNISNSPTLNKLENDIIEKYPSNETSMTMRWFQVNISYNFGFIKVKPKNFSVEYHKVINVIKLSIANKQICRFLTPNKSFGLFALPDMEERRVFIGPYKKGEKHNITFKINDYNLKNSGLWFQPVCPNNIRTLKLLNIAYFDTAKKFIALNENSTTITKNSTSCLPKAISQTRDYDMATLTMQNVAVDSDIYGPSTSNIPILSNINYLSASSNNSDDDDVIIIDKEENVYEISDSE